MFTVADLLKLSEIQGIRLLAGTGGIGREIARINIMDNPDTYDWLISGEFLLSTGYIFRDDTELQRRVIRRLAEIGCSGLAIKTNRYLTSVPDCMIQEAEALDFPLIELPYGHSLSTVGEIAGRRIYQHREDQLAQTMALQRRLTAASLKSASLREIARIAAGCLDNPVLILDSNWRLLAWEDSPKNPYPLDDVLRPKRKAVVLSQQFIEGVPKTLDMFRKPITRRYQLDGGQIICRVAPVAAYDSDTYGYIVVWETVRTLDSADYTALEQIAVSVAIARIRAREIEEVKVRVRRDFFDDLLSGNIESLSAIRSLAELHGLKPDGRYRCLQIRFGESEEEGFIQQQKYSAEAEHCAEICGRIAKNLDLSVAVIAHRTHVVLLAESAGERAESDAQIRRYAEELRDELRQALPNKTPVLIVGAVAVDITEVADVYRDVQSAARMLKTGEYPEYLHFVEDYAVYYLLDKHVDRQSLDLFARKALGELIEHDRRHDSHLLQTLEIYFAKSGNITEVAKQMYIHRNTCIYRLKKIKSILGDDFENPMKLLKYQVALLALRVTDPML